ncbi:hypothetical protein EI427_21585 [Flammeovirga pectinis]|uniref:Lipoprotein n=1 Tax=Flammeovirga pectinis TaxID=2494373 RepID=A0A3S9P9D8_9BACT|nr:hypothetical protein [Flammeovirga pectinis]AZQ64820.1 hypothetical protein EI427_21585 [Flammeovirga pectinis]
MKYLVQIFSLFIVISFLSGCNDVKSNHNIADLSNLNTYLELKEELKFILSELDSLHNYNYYDRDTIIIKHKDISIPILIQDNIFFNEEDIYIHIYTKEVSYLNLYSKIRKTKYIFSDFNNNDSLHDVFLKYKDLYNSESDSIISRLVILYKQNYSNKTYSLE